MGRELLRMRGKRGAFPFGIPCRGEQKGGCDFLSGLRLIKPFRGKISPIFLWGIGGARGKMLLVLKIP